MEIHTQCKWSGQNSNLYPGNKKWYKMLKSVKINFIILIMVILSGSGCVGDSSSDKRINVTAPTNTISAPQLEDTISQDKETIQRLESRISNLESKVSELNDLAKYNGIMKQSERKLIPETPFKLVVCCGKNANYLFRKDGVVEVTEGKDPIPLKSTYIIFYNNNTIKIRYNETNFNKELLSEDIYQDFRLRLFGDYVASIYENGWVRWVSSYTIDTNATNITSKWEEIKPGK